MTAFKLINFAAADGAARAGILIEDRVIELDSALTARGAASAPVTTLGVIEAWDALVPVLDAIAADAGAESVALASVRLLAPLLYPGAIYCAAANYSDHMKEMTGREPDKTKFAPYFFLKTPRHSVIGPGETIRIPGRHTSKCDWEAEIGVVIGRPARDVAAADAMAHVAGYTIVNDLSARDYMNREDWPFLRSDWFGQKCFETSAPMGPWITPADQIADPHDLSIRLWVNDGIEQESSSRFMIFDIGEQIEAISRQLTLRPGDVIATGTCAGVGHPKGRFLADGDTVRITIEGLGTLENPVTRDE